jgi:TrmH family RNA methyltransferase
MLSKNDVKDIQSLCHKKQRDEQQLFIAEGPKLVEEILRSDFEIVSMYGLKDWIKENDSIEQPVVEISEAELKKISSLQTTNKVLVVAKQKRLPDEPVLKNEITLVLDDIQDPGNLGTIIRIADWFGIKQIVASNETVDVYNNKVVQSTMGSLCRVNVWYKELGAFLSTVSTNTYGAVLNGESIYATNKISEGLLIIGNEGKGIHSSVSSFITHPVTIPRVGDAESLNAAVATGIILSHLRM